MSVTFELPHEVGEWLGYSHSDWPPTDRYILSSAGIFAPNNIRLANWYFLTDDALSIVGDEYGLACHAWNHWYITIKDHSRAALFKMRFM